MSTAVQIKVTEIGPDPMDHVKLLKRQYTNAKQLFVTANNGSLEALMLEKHFDDIGKLLDNLEAVLNPPPPAEETPEENPQIDWIEELQKKAS